MARNSRQHYVIYANQRPSHRLDFRSLDGGGRRILIHLGAQTFLASLRSGLRPPV